MELYQYMVQILTIIKENYSDIIGTLVWKRQEIIKGRHPEGIIYSVSSVQTIIHLASENNIFKTKTFEEGREKLNEPISIKGFYSK